MRVQGQIVKTGDVEEPCVVAQTCNSNRVGQPGLHSKRTSPKEGQKWKNAAHTTSIGVLAGW